MNTPKTRNESIVVQEFENEILIYDLKENKAFCLNETSALIYQLCDGKNSVPQISRSLSHKLNQPITEDLIWLALDSFKKDNLLENNEQFEINFNGLSRRQVIKKIGFTSLVMLPVIASVTAPAAAAAASVCSIIGLNVCMTGPVVCSNCPPGTRVRATSYNSNNLSCSGGVQTNNYSISCGGGINGLDYIITGFA